MSESVPPRPSRPSRDQQAGLLEEDDQLVPLRDTTPLLGLATPSPSAAHVKTYTAGEDAGRLQEMAKEFGLQHSRQPRRQVRKERRSSLTQLPQKVVSILLDPSFEDIRMRAIYSSHAADRESISASLTLQRWNASWAELEGIPEEEAEQQALLPQEPVAEDAHAVGLGGTLPSAVLGIIKAMVGPAILYLPHGFASAGYVIALPLMALATVLYLHSSSCLLQCWKRESSRLENNNNSSQHTYQGGDPMEPLQIASKSTKRVHVLLSYPELAYRAFGPLGESVVKIGIALMQSGVCLTYLIFVPQNLHSSLLDLFHLSIPPSYLLIVMVVIQIPLSWIRDIRKFTLTNLLANGLILFGLLTCLGLCLQQCLTVGTAGVQQSAWQNVKEHVADMDAINRQTWFLFIGTSVLLFEGSITLLVPLQEAVAAPQDRAAFPAVYRRVILGILTFYAVFGLTCWMSLGNDVRTIVTTSLPATAWSTSVQLAYCVAVIFTFPLQNFPALEIACRSIGKSLTRTCGVPKQHFLLQRNFISSVLVCLLSIVAVTTMDSLDKVVSLMGSLLGCPIAFVFPPLIHCQLDPTLSVWRKRANYAVATLGFLAMIMASFTTLYQW